ncbi:MAG: Ser-Thr-rich GPI-anchored membrane family protein [Patescibacteria group bacterium]|nr:Ser-Thr-rich GPI-anchored membrane family protein [Patescibacteria group bacterium]
MELNYKKILSWILIAIVVIGVGIWIFLRYTGEKSLQLISPKGNEIWRAGKTYQITWKAKNIGKVGITLIKDKEPRESEWIVEDFPAGKGKYDWQIFAWQEPRQDYKITIIEYPWQEKNKIDSSEKNFTILGPKFASCDSPSIEAEWPYLPSDFPNLRKVFITKKSFQGNLEGLEGADKKCQEEAEEQGFKGTWKAFLGDDNTLAIERLNLEGIFVEAKGTEALLPQETVPVYLWRNFVQFLEKTQLSEKKETVKFAYNLLEKYFNDFLKKYQEQQEEKVCHRLLGKNFDEFLKRLSDSLLISQEKLGKEFSKNLENIWLGRINKESKRDCIAIFDKYLSLDPSLNYSFTTTCQNWTISERKVQGYPPKADEKIELPACYTPEGARVDAAALAGLSLGVIEKEGEQFFSSFLGKTCDLSQKLLCIQQ